jgi:mannose-6-phosphate isomerase-like protein (cupin superfamily)
MTLKIRRVVTGHDASGHAVVKIDEVAKNLVSSRPGATACVVWTTEGFPIDNTGEEDAGQRKTGTTLDNGTVFRILELAPGVTPRNHRTDSIDYAVVMSGEVDMELDDTTVHLTAGDVLVQRGTIHRRLNRSFYFD